MELDKSGQYYLKLLARKRDIETELNIVNADIAEAQTQLIDEMGEANLTEFKDGATGKRFSVVEEVNAKQSDYSKENDVEFMSAMKERGFDIFKYTCNYQTLGATVRNEIMQDGELPDWAQDYIEISKFKRIKVR